MSALLELFTLPPDRLLESVLLVAGIVVACEYLRISLSPVFTRSVVAHLLVNLLTVVIQPVLLAVVLVLSVLAAPERAGLNFLIVAGMYGVWYLAGQSTLLARPDTQGADVGFMTIGGVLTFLPGAIAVLAA
ncbi:hypothetical protein [Haliangium sp.]|uniref:hypothetical protein n=1 Tax=Haliangium sp. TaxID=2663208 RepID=UPI003D0A29DF